MAATTNGPEEVTEVRGRGIKPRAKPRKANTDPHADQSLSGGDNQDSTEEESVEQHTGERPKGPGGNSETVTPTHPRPRRNRRDSRDKKTSTPSQSHGYHGYGSS